MTYSDGGGVGFQPIDYIIKVFRTKALAELGNEEDALSVYHSYSDPVVSHAAQVIQGYPTDVSGSSQLIDAGLEQIQTMTIPADSSNSLDGKYFKVFVPSASATGMGTGRADRMIVVWFNTDGGSATAPGVDGVNSYVEVAISTNDNATTVAAAAASALDSDSNFNASGTGSSTSTLTIKNEYKGYCTTAVDGNAGITSVAVTQTGRLAANFGSDLVGAEIEAPGTGLKTTVSSKTNATTLVLADDIFHATTTLYRINNKPSHFFTYQRYFYRIESTDPVKGFIIDWDDGEDNSPEKANRQEIILDSPQYYAVVEHVYTTHQKYYPMVRTISPEGFYSKWYASAGAVIDTGGNTLVSLEETTLSPGQNDFSIVSLDTNQFYDRNPRIPEFYPANTPPIAILKVDRNEVRAGIDNSRIPAWSENVVEPRAIAYIDGHSSSATIVSALEVIYKNHEDKIFKETIAITNQASGSDSLKARFPNDGGAEASTGTATAAGSDPVNGYLKELLSVKLIKLAENKTSTEDATKLEMDERVRIHVYDAYSSGINDVDPPLVTGTTADTCLCQVSNGDPIVTLERPGYSVLVDGGQSLVKNSNRSLSAYFFEEGKLDQIGSSRQITLISQTGDVFELNDGSAPAVNSTTFGNQDTSKRISYALDPTGDTVKDSQSRYWKQERLIRLQVKDDWTGDNGGDDMTYSFLEHDSIDTYADASTTGLRPDEYKTRGLLWYANFKQNYQQWENKAEANQKSTTYVFGSTSAADSLTSSANNNTELTAYTGNGVVMNPPNWLLLGRDNLFDKVHLRMNNAHRAYTAPNVTLVMYYPARLSPTSSKYTWKPLQFTDNTNHDTTNTSLRNSGSLAFELPSDWAKVKASDLETSVTAGWSGPISNFVGPNLTISTNARDINSVGLAEVQTTTSHDLSNGDFVHIHDSDDSTYDISTKITKVDADEFTYYTTHTSVNNIEGTVIPKIYWEDDLYAILVGIACSADASDLASYRCASVHTYNNEHSAAINVIDGHHKSLNDIAIAQSVSWVKKGKFHTIEDRFGRAEIQKLGAAGGNVTFGGVELGDFTQSSGGTDAREKLAIYQRKGTPVYLDIVRANGDSIRFFGKIENMSEDVPVGNQYPKFGITMIVSHIAEFDENGAWITNGMISLGGEVIDEPKYLL
jgi:hypothetical protein